MYKGKQKKHENKWLSNSDTTMFVLLIHITCHTCLTLVRRPRGAAPVWTHRARWTRTDPAAWARNTARTRAVGPRQSWAPTFVRDQRLLYGYTLSWPNTLIKMPPSNMGWQSTVVMRCFICWNVRLPSFSMIFAAPCICWPSNERSDCSALYSCWRFPLNKMFFGLVGLVTPIKDVKRPTW